MPLLRLIRFAGVELALWASVYGAYLAVRGLTIGAPGAAVAHAHDLVGLERALGVFREASLQAFLAPAARFFSAYYMLGFGPVIAVTAIWLGIRHQDRYRKLRNALLLSISLATVVFVLFPTAPPRLAGLGIADTVGLSGHDTGSFLGIRFNPYAAVPSMHVGWSFLVALAGFRTARRRPVRALFAVHPVLMAVTVSATGNHFFFDAAAGLAVASLTLVLLGLRSGDLADAIRGRLPQIRPMELSTKEMTMEPATAKRELAHRASNGVNVSLFWTKVGDLLTLEVYDERLDEFFELEVPKDRALDAFHHPYVYLAGNQAALAAEPIAA
jgi:hypothetical protein